MSPSNYFDASHYSPHPFSSSFSDPALSSYPATPSSLGDAKSSSSVSPSGPGTRISGAAGIGPGVYFRNLDKMWRDVQKSFEEEEVAEEHLRQRSESEERKVSISMKEGEEFRWQSPEFAQGSIESPGGNEADETLKPAFSPAESRRATKSRPEQESPAAKLTSPGRNKPTLTSSDRKGNPSPNRLHYRNRTRTRTRTSSHPSSTSTSASQSGSSLFAFLASPSNSAAKAIIGRSLSPSLSRPGTQDSPSRDIPSSRPATRAGDGDNFHSSSPRFFPLSHRSINANHSRNGSNVQSRPATTGSGSSSFWTYSPRMGAPSIQTPSVGSESSSSPSPNLDGSSSPFASFGKSRRRHRTTSSNRRLGQAAKAETLSNEAVLDRLPPSGSIPIVVPQDLRLRSDTPDDHPLTDRSDDDLRTAREGTDSSAAVGLGLGLTTMRREGLKIPLSPIPDLSENEAGASDSPYMQIASSTQLSSLEPSMAVPASVLASHLLPRASVSSESTAGRTDRSGSFQSGVYSAYHSASTASSDALETPSASPMAAHFSVTGSSSQATSESVRKRMDGIAKAKAKAIKRSKVHAKKIANDPTEPQTVQPSTSTPVNRRVLSPPATPPLEAFVFPRPAPTPSQVLAERYRQKTFQGTDALRTRSGLTSQRPSTASAVESPDRSRSASRDNGHFERPLPSPSRQQHPDGLNQDTLSIASRSRRTVQNRRRAATISNPILHDPSTSANQSRPPVPGLPSLANTSYRRQSSPPNSSAAQFEQKSHGFGTLTARQRELFAVDYTFTGVQSQRVQARPSTAAADANPMRRHHQRNFSRSSSGSNGSQAASLRGKPLPAIPSPTRFPSLANLRSALARPGSARPGTGTPGGSAGSGSLSSSRPVSPVDVLQGPAAYGRLPQGKASDISLPHADLSGVLSADSSVSSLVSATTPRSVSSSVAPIPETISIIIDQESFREISATFQYVSFNRQANLFSFTPLEPLASYPFHYGSMQAAPILRRLIVPGWEERDFITKQASLPVRSEGRFVVEGWESKGTLGWRFEYAVADRLSLIGKVMQGEKNLIPISFTCTPGLRDPANSRKRKVLNIVYKSFAPRLEAVYVGGLPEEYRSNPTEQE